MFLLIGLFLDVFEKILTLKFAEYGEGIHIVPILAMGSVFLGIYYNLSVWYKLTNRNLFGAVITVIGAVITILLNIWWIPKFGYTGSAWATFCCYAFMMASSYWMGQRKYRIPYAKKKLIAYLVISTIVFFIHRGLVHLYDNIWFSIATGAILFMTFFWFIALVERKEFKQLPLVGKYF